MSKITDHIVSKTNALKVVPEQLKPVYKQFNSGSVEVEVAELLYTLVLLQKPNYIVETGTHKGISALYMALAMEENGNGNLTTYEIIKPHQDTAKALWKDLKIGHRIDSQLTSSLKVKDCPTPIDILFLDSEPQLRFDEFLLYWPWVSSGGFIAIHDLHKNLGHSDTIRNKMYDWPYGDYRLKLGSFIKEHKVQTMTFPTGRGFTLFQKEGPGFEWTRYLRSNE